MRLRIVFMGSPEFAVPTLHAILPGHDVVLAVCQPDKPAGRGQKLTPPAVKLAAEAAGVPVAQPRSARTEEFRAQLAALAPDVAVVVAYGKILPQSVLDVPRLGCLNVHGSLLPRYRGAAPLAWAIIRGEHETGITTMKLDAGMDTGPMLLRAGLPIGDDDTAGSLAPRMAELGARLMLETLAALAAGTLVETPQDGSLATMAPMMEKSLGGVDFSRTAREVSCLMRGVDPWPGAQTGLPGPAGVEVLKLWAPRVVEGRGAPGTVLGVEKAGLVVACGEGALAIGELQLPGRRRMLATALCAGRPIAPGTVLATPPPAASEPPHGR